MFGNFENVDRNSNSVVTAKGSSIILSVGH